MNNKICKEEIVMLYKPKTAISVSMPITGCVSLRFPFRNEGAIFASKRLSHERFVIKQNMRVRKVLEIKWKQTGMSGESEKEDNQSDCC